jgi:rSAM/selenodomain-associated transferase 1
MPRTIVDTPAIVFAKAPWPGAVKTRLIPHLGAEAAAALHARLVKHTLRTVRQAGFREVQLHGAPADDPFLRYCASRYGASLVEQCAGDLGMRMHHAFERAVEVDTGVLLMGTDCPALTARHLRQAARALADDADAVFLPVEDGGYALIGLAHADFRVFAGVEWGGACVMEQTRQRLRDLGWRWSELETLWDVDSAVDYERLVASRLLDSPPQQEVPRPLRDSGAPDSF